MSRVRTQIFLVCVDSLRADLFFAPAQYTDNFGVPFSYPDAFKQLLDRGLSFTKCITAAPYTTSSHASIFTGLYPASHGMVHFFNSRLHSPTIFTDLQQHGFATYFSTDFPGILGSPLNFVDGVDHFYEGTENQLLKDVSAASSDTVSFIHFADVHWPYGFHRFDSAKEVEALERFLTQHAAAIEYSYPNDVSYIPNETARTGHLRELEFRYNRLIGQYYDRRKFGTLMRWYTNGAERFGNGRFHNFISKLLHLLDRTNTNTLVLFFADHGELWDSNCYGHYNSCQMGVINVPLVFLHNQNRVPSQMDQVVRTIDIVPSVYDILEIKTALIPDGTSVFKAKDQPRTAITQSWVCDYKQMSSLMQRIEQGAAMTDYTLDMHLHEESIVSSLAQYRRKLSAKGDILEESIVHTSDANRSGSHFNLISELDKYHTRLAGKIPAFSERTEMIKQFRSLGYFGGTK